MRIRPKNATTRRSRPAPEFLVPERWEYADSAGRSCVDLANRRIQAPGGESDEDYMLRTHEMAHVRYSPDGTPPEADHTILNAVEDSRVDILAQRALPPSLRTRYMDGAAELHDIPPEDAVRMAKMMSPHNLAEGALCLLAAAIGVGQETLAACVLIAESDIRYRHLPPIADTMVGDLREIYQEPDDPDCLRRAYETVAAAIARFEEKPDPVTIKDLVERQADEVLDRRGMPVKALARGAGPVRWGEMRISHPRLTDRYRPRSMGRRFTASDVGVEFRHPERVLTDGKPFGRKRRIPGGTLLVDHSGSMSLTVEDMRQIIDAAPAAKIADYCGGVGGELRVIGENGRLADERTLDDTMGIGNVVDYPALEWLACQPGPRIWVSDAYVGPTDGDAVAGLRQCMDLVRRAGIIWVPDTDDALDILRRIVR